MCTLRRFLCLFTFACWWGGLITYTSIVVPTGTEIFGATSQGFVTQRVTDWLNLLAGVSLAFLLWDSFYTRSRLLWFTWSLLAAFLGMLVWLHLRMDAMLDRANLSVIDHSNFDRAHRAYLWGITFQWFVGMVHLWGLVRSHTSSTRGVDNATAESY